MLAGKRYSVVDVGYSRVVCGKDKLYSLVAVFDVGRENAVEVGNLSCGGIYAVVWVGD